MEEMDGLNPGASHRIMHLFDFSLSKSAVMDKPAAPPEMVVVAQLVEPRIVIPVVAGSSPVDHPIFPIGISAEVWRGEEETE